MVQPWRLPACSQWSPRHVIKGSHIETPEKNTGFLSYTEVNWKNTRKNAMARACYILKKIIKTLKYKEMNTLYVVCIIIMLYSRGVKLKFIGGRISSLVPIKGPVVSVGLCVH